MIETVVLVGLAVFIVYKISRPSRSHPKPVATEQITVFTGGELSEHDRAAQIIFDNVFAIMSDKRRESLLMMYMSRDKCSRIEAMRKAVADRQKDADLAF